MISNRKVEIREIQIKKIKVLVLADVKTNRRIAFSPIVMKNTEGRNLLKKYAENLGWRIIKNE